MFVLTIDQIGSRSGDDRVPELLARLGSYECERPFERTVGDEVQGVISDPSLVREIALALIRDGSWHIGIGAGEASLSDTARSGTGPAYLHARSAVERAKSANRFTPSVAVDSDQVDAAASAESLLRVLGFIISGRTDAQWEAIDAHRAGESVSDIADRLGISVEAVSQRRGYGAQSIEEAAWPTLDALLDGAQ